MNRLIFVPQFPAPLRYQFWMLEEFPKSFKFYFDDVIVLGEKYLKEISNERIKYTNTFSPLKQSIEFENAQIKEYLDLDLNDSDILFHMDLSYPGFFSNVLYHKRPNRMFSFCHATSKNTLDYFESVKDSKWLVECGHAKLFNKVFVATNYHKEKLGWDNLYVTHSLPNPPFKTYCKEKVRDIISVSRVTPQKVNSETEKMIEEIFKTKIERRDFGTWKEYFKFISGSRIMLITSKEETYGYQVVDAVLNGCIPICPNKYSYPELLSRDYLYDNDEELVMKIRQFLTSNKRPVLINEEHILNFYENISNVMKG